MTKARTAYAADFETTTSEDDCRVWAWGLAEIDFPDDVEDGTSLETFIRRITRESSTVYFHNLKFDGHFIIDWLLKNGYIHLAEKHARLEPLSFKTLISDMGKFYSMSVKWANGVTTEFRDSLKKLPFGIARIAESFKLPMVKGELDYTAFRHKGHKITDAEREYLHNDVSILANAMREVINNGMTKLTIGSDSLAEYKRMTGKIFDKTFPILDMDMDAVIRRSYRGGYTYLNPKFKGKQGSGLVLDVNSLYPFIMRTQVLPYGMPEWVDGQLHSTTEHPLYVQNVTITAKLKPDHLPCIQLKNHFRFAPTEYLSEIKEPVSVTLTNVDWELFNEHYDIEVYEWGGGYAFKGVAGFFDMYVDKWSGVKAQATGGLREIAKLHLNSLYGKFATNPLMSSRYPVLTENGSVKYVRGEDEERPPVYTAMGSFITAYARAYTIRAAQKNYGVFAYADTDSLHLMTSDIPEDINVHPTDLGAWKLEYRFKESFYVRAKVYLEMEHDGTYHSAFAGLPERIAAELTFDDLVPGKVFHDKLTPKSVPGGVILKQVDFTLNM